MQEILLQLENISVHYGGVRALDGVDLAIDEGEIVALVGPNGAGKSTILRAIFGLAEIAAGKVFWHGERIAPISYEVAQMGVSFVPQGRRVFGHLSVLENLEIGGFHIESKSQMVSRVKEVVDIFPVLGRKRKDKAGSLSGGEQQMVVLARGLMTDPKVLLLDEPSLGLAPKIVREVFQKIKEISERRKTAILIVEHNIKSLLTIATRAYVLDKGQIIHEGKSQEVLQGHILERVFAGKF
ncbi:ABC transporter ATP-binding protein [Candidatus Wolfebacteria bacterium]|nr:ABC transporter ATP-binding protein [Candidatus Wolfebacteria bacterium]